jgi:eukaryotic-like serine/threonine-protein kinase
MADEALATGTRMGNYRIERLLGRGGMGEVYVATHTLLDKRVALKVLARHLVKDQALVQRFVREGRAAARVRHDNVIEVFDVGIEGEVPYLAMELLEGEPLAALYARGALPPETLAALLLPVAAAVASAHAHGIVHRDLKPDNVFLRRDTRGQVQPIVLDFGISKLAEDVSLNLTETSAVMGTPYYMSPEQARGAKNVTGATDQYALGVMLYEGATGKRPFDGESLLELVYKITSGEFVPPATANPAVPPALADLIVKAMARQAGDRYVDVWTFGQALLPFAAARERETWRSVFAAKAQTGAIGLEETQAPAAASPSTTMRNAAGEVGGAAKANRLPMGALLGVAGAIASLAGLGIGLHLRERVGPPDRTLVVIDAGAAPPAAAGGGAIVAPPILVPPARPDAGAESPPLHKRKRKHQPVLTPDDFLVPSP